LQIFYDKETIHIEKNHTFHEHTKHIKKLIVI